MHRQDFFGLKLGGNVNSQKSLGQPLLHYDLPEEEY